MEDALGEPSSVAVNVIVFVPALHADAVIDIFAVATVPLVTLDVTLHMLPVLTASDMFWFTSGGNDCMVRFNVCPQAIVTVLPCGKPENDGGIFPAVLALNEKHWLSR
jgi:hypothetical protein